MKRLGYRIVTAGLLLFWMGIIFWFSAQQAKESQQMSGSFAYRIVSTCENIFSLDMTEEENLSWAERIDYPIRKVAHMTEYAVLAVLCAICTWGYAPWNGRTAGISFCISVIYAASDEIHQLFVPGRAGRISDVGIDSIGIILGLLLITLLVKILRKHCEKRVLLLK